MQNRYKQSFKHSDSKNVELSIYNCGLQSCEGGHSWGPGMRDHYLIHLVLSGRGSYTCGGKTYTVNAGEMFLTKPNQRIMYVADESDPWEYYWVGFNGTQAGYLVQQLPFTDEKPYLPCTETEKAKGLLHSIYLNRGTSPYHETQMAGYLYLFIGQLMRQKENDGSKNTPTTGSRYVINAVKYIQYNYSHDIGVDDIAKAVGVSRSHLYRVFVGTVGVSPIDYLTEFRIGEACSLLENTSLSISEIAYSVGFYDQFYFSRVFKKIKGVPPSRYQGAGTPAEGEQA